MSPDLITLSLIVNGKSIEREIPATLRLVDFLRYHLNLTGTKESCGEGECGSCTVMLNGKPVNSCLILAVETEGSEIQTIEGLGAEKTLTDVQQAFVRDHAVQCGYCIPGMVLMGEVIRKDFPEASREDIRQHLSGNMCRCTGYAKIVDAIADRENQ